MTESIAKNAGKMGIATFISRILGLLREQVFAFLFGASNAADAFNIAFRIPNLLRDLFAEGAMSSAFVPNFTRALTKSTTNAFSILAGVLSILLIGVGVLTLVGVYFSEELVFLYAHAFKAIPGKFELAVGLTKVMFPFLPLVAMAAVTMGALNAMGAFFLPSFAPVLFNVASILAGILLCPALKKWTSIEPIYGMAIGVVIGGFLQFYVQWWQIQKKGFKYSQFIKDFLKPFSNPDVKKVLWLLIPGTIGLAATQLNILINSIYATHSGPGAVSWLNYAFRLMQFPIGIFGVSFAAATLPVVARKLALNDSSSAASELKKSLSITFAVNAPAAAGLIALSLPIVQVLFQHGAFNEVDARNTATAVICYALGLPAYSAVKVLVPIFYALGTTRIPVVLSFVSVGLNAGLNHLFLNIVGYPFWILALATSITVTLNAVFLILFLKNKLPGFMGLGLFWSYAKHTALSGLVGFVAFFTSQYLKVLVFRDSLGFFAWSIQVGIGIGLAVMVWLLVGRLFKVTEVDFIFEFFKKKLYRLSSK